MENIVTKIVTKVGSDKVMHAETCALIAVVAKRCTGRVVIATAVALVLGILKEVYDVTTGEPFDCKDVAADAVGAVLGAMI